MPSWSHNALPWVTPDGGISIWHIGNGTTSRPQHTGCTNGTTPLHAQPATAASNSAGAAKATGAVGNPHPILISHIPYSKGPSGPWRMTAISCNTAAAAGEVAPGPCPIDNPSPLSLPNGTTLIVHRAKKGFGVLSAPQWTGPFRNIVGGLALNATNIPIPADEFSCEDGFLFHGQQRGGGGIHLLCHCNGVFGYPWDDHGRHAFSADGGVTWRWSKGRAFPPAFIHSDGSNTTHISRQRPQLVFGALVDGVPTQLITGIAVASTNRPFAWQSDCAPNGLDAVSKPCDLTATYMQPVLP
jgi:hypothetical protein